MNAISTRTTAPALIAAFCLLATVAGCQSRTSNADRQAMSDGSPNSLEQRVSDTHASSGHGPTTVMLTDASFNGMPAVQVSAPSGWRVQGQAALSTCPEMPFASWDATSPDGQSQMNVLPPFGWRWGRGVQAGNGCIPLTGPLTAADFLQKFAARLRGVQVVGPMPVDEAFRRREEKFTNNANNANARMASFMQAHNTGDVAAIRAVDSTGHEMRLRASVSCQESRGRWFQGGNCFAKVDILRTPKGRLDALVALVDSHNLLGGHPTEEWKAALMNRMQQRNQREGDARLAEGRREAAATSQMMSDAARASNQRMQDQHNAFMGQMQQQQANHEAFMGQMQSATDSSMQNTANNMNARSTSASDMEDYALDQQTVSGANGTYKTSSQYTNVWSSPVGPANSDGRTFGSMDNTIDPNGATDNTWTKDTKVHGNGQPY
jgi:regulator of protease activity HflC (stomatin/prohibitin superfamily)